VGTEVTEVMEVTEVTAVAIGRNVQIFALYILHTKFRAVTSFILYSSSTPTPDGCALYHESSLSHYRYLCCHK